MNKHYEKPTLAVTAIMTQGILLASGERQLVDGELDGTGKFIGYTLWDAATWN